MLSDCLVGRTSKPKGDEGKYSPQGRETSLVFMVD